MFGILILIGILGAITGKCAARKGRFGPLWFLYGAVLFPVAFLHVLLAKRVEACPACGRGLKCGMRCKRCGYEEPRPLDDAIVQNDLADLFGFTLGETFEPVLRKMRENGWTYLLEDQNRISSQCVRCVGIELLGRDAQLALDFDDGALAQIRVTYPADGKYEIYYDLRARLVARYGKPVFGNYDVGHSDNWTASQHLLSLSTGHDGDASPSTTLSCLKLDPALCEALNEGALRV